MKIENFNPVRDLMMERTALQNDLAELRRLRGLASEGAGMVTLSVMSERHTNETRVTVRLPAAGVHTFLAAEIAKRGREIDAELQRLGVEIHPEPARVSSHDETDAADARRKPGGCEAPRTRRRDQSKHDQELLSATTKTAPPTS